MGACPAQLATSSSCNGMLDWSRNREIASGRLTPVTGTIDASSTRTHDSRAPFTVASQLSRVSRYGPHPLAEAASNKKRDETRDFETPFIAHPAIERMASLISRLRPCQGSALPTAARRGFASSLTRPDPRKTLPACARRRGVGCQYPSPSMGEGRSLCLGPHRSCSSIGTP